MASDTRWGSPAGSPTARSPGRGHQGRRLRTSSGWLAVARAGAVPYRPEPAHVLITEAGEIDIFTVARLREALFTLAGDGRPLIADLDRVTFLGAAGLGVAYEYFSACRGLCLLVQLRAELPGRAGWLGRVAVPVAPDSPSVFGGLLDRAAGQFRFGPTSAQVPHQRRYVPGTMVLETTWHTPTGWLVVHDLLAVGRTDVSRRRAGYCRGPTDFGATGVLLRTATCIGGEVEVMGAIMAAATTSLPETPGGAQLGLPLHLDPGLGVYAPVAV